MRGSSSTTQSFLKLAGAAGIALLVTTAFAQGNGGVKQQAGAGKFAYEVVSIKYPRPDSHVGVWEGPSELRGFHVTVNQLVESAYGVRPSQVSGGAAWTNSERFDVEAKMDAETAAALDKLPKDQQKAQRQAMLQAVLADRFQLKAHRGKKEIPVYALVIAKGGSRLKVADDKASTTLGISKSELPGGLAVSWNESRITGGGDAGLLMACHGVPMSRLVDMLNFLVDKIVVDKTGLTGNYDIKLSWIPQDQHAKPTEEAGGALLPADPGPTIFSALEKQLGLRLETVKAPMDAIVIDHVERPSPN